MGQQVRLFAYKTEAFARRTRWLLVCREDRVEVYRTAKVATQSACCLGTIALGFSALLAPLIASLAAKAEDEPRLNAAAMAVEKTAVRDLDEALQELDLHRQADASDLFLRSVELDTGRFEIETMEAAPFVSGTLVGGADTALDHEGPREALESLRDWLCAHGALIGR
jgi:hypothetical protein